MPRRNRVDPYGDLHAVAARGLFTGNRGCVVDDHEQVVRHHGSALWIVCLTRFRDWRWPLARPRRWTPLFFLDDAVALAAGHRPCGFCRRDDYRAYRDAVGRAWGSGTPLAKDLDAALQQERLRTGRGLLRARDRKCWRTTWAQVPDGAVTCGTDGSSLLVLGPRLLCFDFNGWQEAGPRPRRGDALLLTPPTSVAALAHGFVPTLHPSAGA